MTQIRLTDVALARAMADSERDRQREVLTARILDAGLAGAALTDRLKQYVVPTELSLNICKPVIAAVVDRLRVMDWEAVPDTDIRTMGRASSAPVRAASSADGTPDVGQAAGDWAWSLWKALGLDVTSDLAHRMAMRDGEAFALVSPRLGPDGVTTGLQVSIHPRWTATEASSPVKTTAADASALNAGDDYGMKIWYPNDDMGQPPLYASLWWVEVDSTGDRVVTTRRRTLYFADRVEKYRIGRAGIWEPVTDPGDAGWPIPWVDSTGAPLGVPVAHFVNDETTCEARSVWGLQGAINKSLIDLLTAADATAFRIFVARGFVPTTDGRDMKEDRSNLLRIQPGSTISIAKDAEAQLDVIEGASVAPLADVVDKLLVYASVVSGVPLTAFQMTRQLAGAETLSEQKAPLIARTERAQKSFGRAWQSVLTIARRLANVYMLASLPEDYVLLPVWAPAKTEDPAARLAEAQGLRGLGVPAEIVWAKAGLTRAEIEAALASDEYQATLTAQRQALGRPNA